MAKNRGERVNEEMKKTLAAIVFDMKDPRISPMTTITEAEVTNDLKYCKVSVSVYDTDENARKETVAALNRAHRLGGGPPDADPGHPQVQIHAG